MTQKSISRLIKSYWIEMTVPSLLFGMFILLLYLSFGHAYYFDKLFLLVLVGLLSVFRNNKDLFYTLLLLLVARSFGEVIFLLSDKEPFKWVYYVVSILTVSQLKYDKLVPILVVPIIALCLTAELYWYLTDYAAPELHYYVLGLVINCLIRHFLVFKAHFKFYSDLKLINKPLDYSLYKLNIVSSIVTCILIVEYLIRHLTQFTPMIVYDSYSYILQVISVLLLYLVVDYSIKSKFKLLA